MAKSLILRLLEIILGGLFFYAGYLKLLHPEDFAEAVMAYRLLPMSLMGAMAAVLPWLEVAAGLFLAVGLKRRSCLLLLGFLTGGFLLVMLVTLARGLKIDCGCGLFFTRQVGLVPILEDGVILLGAAGLYYWELMAAREATARGALTANGH
ncbi:MAG: DoxX family membrane protein [Deltaproteobacteria bacterium]|nr:DoxX family membrane protein [Deltaproteobacteria bacterium]